MNFENLKPFLQRWAITTLAVLVAANVVDGIHYDTLGGLLVASLLLGVLNAFLRPVMLLLSLPLLILTLGLFTLVINAMLLSFVGWLVRPFHVDSFGAAFWGSLVISIVSLVVNLMLGTHQVKIETRRGKGPPGGRDSGDGPVIDV
ncbi:MAG: phage holin family protein [Verrucomicrobia bacterium]|nr:phage holin family protein [Verrucomicrobiota bacterium]